MTKLKPALTMAISLPKRKSSHHLKKLKERHSCFYDTVLFKLLNRIPAAIFLVVFLFLWSSSSTIISGKFIHVCVSSRKLANLYCVSAGAQPNFEIPLPTTIKNSGSNSSSNGDESHVNRIVEVSGEFKSEASVNNNGSVSAESVHENRPHFAVPDSPTTVINNSGSNSSSNDDESNVKRIVEVSGDFKSEASVNSNGSISAESVHENRPDFTIPNSTTTMINNSSSNSNSNGDESNVNRIVEVSDDFKSEASVNSTGSVSAESIHQNPPNFAVPDSPTNPDGEDDDEIAKAIIAIEKQLKHQRSWMWQSSGENPAAVCDGRGIYVYELPPKFNKDLVSQCNDMVPWMNFCNYFRNEALGEPIPSLGKQWFQTHQYSLEPIFHSRILHHRCRVLNEDEAKLFYVPYYGGLDVLRWHFKNNVSNAVKDSLGFELVQWLTKRQTWIRNGGKDHVFVLGKISWDFRRNSSDESSWGTKFLEQDEMQSPMKLLIERQPWHENDVGIPHPTFFHPHSDGDVFDWQRRVIRSERKNLVAFAGAARPGAADNVRSIVIKDCNSSSWLGKCRHLDCSLGDCERPETVMELFLESEFCLQPPGDSPTRKSVFDSLIAGCIPVFFDPFTAYYQYPWHLPEDHSKYSVFLEKKKLQRNGEDVVKKLMEISPKKREEMRSYIVYELLPGLVYGDSNNELHKFQDAFAIAINNLLQMVSNL